MSEKPIPFSAPMVRAILNSSKTQTRRVVRPQPAALPELSDAEIGRLVDRMDNARVQRA